MTFYAQDAGGSFNLQATLATSSAVSDPPVAPHHPVTCSTVLSFTEDGTFACEHAQVPAGDHRTQHCIDHSIALLLIELLREKEDADAG